MLHFGASSPGSYLPAKHGYDSLLSRQALGFHQPRLTDHTPIRPARKQAHRLILLENVGWSHCVSPVMVVVGWFDWLHALCKLGAGGFQIHFHQPFDDLAVMDTVLHRQRFDDLLV